MVSGRTTNAFHARSPGLSHTLKQALFADVCIVLPFLLSACALGEGSLRQGHTEAQIISRLGQPTQRHHDGRDRLLEYMHGPFGQVTYMVRLGPDGRMLSYEQVLTLEKFGTIRPGKARKEDVLKTVGTPSEVRYFPRTGLLEWSYPYKEAGIWDSMMSIYLDNAGTVRKLENGPDQRRMMWDD